MRSKHYVAAVLLSVSAGLPAASADLPVLKGVAPAPVFTAFSWTGFYVGGQLGYGFGYDVTKEFLTANRAFLGLQNYYRPRGFFGGLHAGYNYQFGSIVAGIEADAEISDVRAGFTDPPVPPFNPGGHGSTRFQLQGSIRGRLGYTFDRTMLYLTGGVAGAQIENVYKNWALVTEKISKNVLGGTVGGGVEHAVTNYLTLRAEYRFTAYKSYWNHSVVAFPGASATQHPRTHTLRLGASYKF